MFTLVRAVAETKRNLAGNHSAESLESLLKDAGVAKGKTVLDFGCGRGTYTIPAARIVGNEGIVYALEQDKTTRDDLWAQTKSMGLGNIQIVSAVSRAHIKLPDESIDVILLYDVLHSWYHPQSRQRKQILTELYRVLCPCGLLSFYPGDPEVFHHHTELAAILREIGDADFYLQSKETQTLIHEGNIVQGHVFAFKKVQA